MVIRNLDITAAIQHLVNKISFSLSLSQSHLNAIHLVLIANEHGYENVPAQDQHKVFPGGNVPVTSVTP
jgi:uncharacterized protein YtpQ (UPF0354 family)